MKKLRLWISLGIVSSKLIERYDKNPGMSTLDWKEFKEVVGKIKGNLILFNFVWIPRSFELKIKNLFLKEQVFISEISFLINLFTLFTMSLKASGWFIAKIRPIPYVSSMLLL